MNILNSINELTSKYTVVIMLVFGAIGYLNDQIFIWVKGTPQNLILGAIIFCMGLSITKQQLETTVKKPKYIISGALCQYLLMPLICLMLVSFFKVDFATKIGLVLVACVPGAAASNIMSYLAKGDVSLSVCITLLTTAFSPFITPFLIYLFLHKSVEVNFLGMLKTMLIVVLIPLILGVVVRSLLKEKQLNYMLKMSPILAVFGLGLIVAGAVSQTGRQFFSFGIKALLLTFSLNILGYLFALITTKALKFPIDKQKTISIETGMQNAGMAITLASTYFSEHKQSLAIAAFACAWFALTGSIYSKFLQKIN